MNGKNIVIIGFMGTGKSVTGRILAEKLGYTFVDMDRAIEEQYESSISDIFKYEGEKAFRYKETAMARKLSRRKKQVISTGGGVAAKDEDMNYLRHNGIIVSLKATPKTIFERTNNNRRPLLANLSKEERMKTICERLKEREPYYKRADLIINTDNSTPSNNAETIIKLLNKMGFK